MVNKKLDLLSKIKKWKKRSIIAAFLFVLLGILIQGFLSEIFHITLIGPLTEPIKTLLSPPVASVIIDPNLYPISTDRGTHIVTVSLVNDGTKTLEDIWVDYQFMCTMNKTERGHLKSKTKLLPGGETFFEFEVSGLNTSCAISSQPIALKFYKDKAGLQYVKMESTVSKMCMYCPLMINVTAKDFFYEYAGEYPYFDGELMQSGKMNADFLPYESAQNKDELIYLPEMDFSTPKIIDVGTACLRGDFNAVQCREYVSKIPPRK